MSGPVTISVEGLPGSGKSLVLEKIAGLKNFTVVKDSLEEMFDTITSKGVKNLMDPWTFFMEKPAIRGPRFTQTMMVRKAEEMARTFDTRFKVVERSVPTTRYIVAKFAEGMGVDDLDVSVVKELYKLLAMEPKMIPDLFVIISHLPTEYMDNRYEGDNARFKEWRKGREVQHEWNRLTNKFSARPEFSDKVVFIDGQTTKDGLVEHFLEAVKERFPEAE